MKTFETPEPISVTVELSVGDVTIAAGDRVDTLVDVRPSNPSKKADVTAAEQTRIEFTGGRLLVKGPKGWRTFAPWSGGGAIDVQIDVPTGSHVRGEAAVASLRTTGRLGECRYKISVGNIHLDEAEAADLRTVAGDLIVDHLRASCEVTTGSGEISIGTIDGKAVIKNSNGDTWVGRVSGDLRANAANGKIAVDHSFANVMAKTACGDIRLGEVVTGEVVTETAYGTIDVGVRHGVAAWLDLCTGFGNVRNDMEAAGSPMPGEATVEVRAQTSFGDITVGRSAALGTEKEEA